MRNDEKIKLKDEFLSMELEISCLGKNRMSFDITRQLCCLSSEELTEDQLIDNYYCRECGYTVDEHKSKRMSRDFE